MIWDVYTFEGMGRDGNARWSYRAMPAADTPEELIEVIRKLGVRGKFKAYPQDCGMVIQAHIVEVYEVERLR